MNVYELIADSNPYRVYTVNTTSRIDCDGQLLSPSWTPLKLEVMRGHRKKPPCDFLFVCSGLICNVISQKALTLIGEMLEPYGEILPLVGKDGIYFAYNLTCRIDSLDKKNSITTPGSIKSYTFYPEIIGNRYIFRIPESHLRIYVTDPFVEKIKNSDLKGFSFKKLWSND